MPQSPKAAIFIVDDDEAVRRGLGALLAVKGYAVESFESAERFLAAVPALRPACLLVDLRMPGMSGLELQREVKQRKLDLPIVVITGHGEVSAAVTALKAGAVDFLEKPFDSDALLAAVAEAIRMAGAGAAVAEDRAALAARVETLTPREREVMDLVVAGHPNKVVAHRLGIAIRTVEIHRAHVMEKTGARNLSELIRLALRLQAPETAPPSRSG